MPPFLLTIGEYLLKLLPPGQDKKEKRYRASVLSLLVACSWLLWQNNSQIPVASLAVAEKVDSLRFEIKSFMREQMRVNKDMTRDNTYLQAQITEIKLTMQGMKGDIENIDDKCDNYLLEKIRKRINNMYQ